MIEAATDTRNPKLEGWARSGLSKWHYYRGNRSLCKHWPMFTPVDGFKLGEDESPDNCVRCRRKVLAEQEITP